MNCEKCNSQLSKERVEAINWLSLPKRCIDCSSIEAPVALMNYSHKTSGEVLIVPQNSDGTNDQEKVRIALRAYRRSR